MNRSTLLMLTAVCAVGLAGCVKQPAYSPYRSQEQKDMAMLKFTPFCGPPTDSRVRGCSAVADMVLRNDEHSIYLVTGMEADTGRIYTLWHPLGPTTDLSPDSDFNPVVVQVYGLADPRAEPLLAKFRQQRNEMGR